MAVFAPIPNASESTAIAVKSGVRRNPRRANRMSFQRLLMIYSVDSLDAECNNLIECEVVYAARSQRLNIV